MNVGLKAYVIQDIGHRDNQEDSFYPPFLTPHHFMKTERDDSYYESTAHTDDSLFVLCDGMGGHEHGEVASRIVCDEVSNYIVSQERMGREFCDDMLHEAVVEALKALDAAESDDTLLKMGTTMTLLKFHGDGATIAHVGDSRVYHFRPAYGYRSSRILFRTEDHNLANMLLKSGRLTYQQLPNFDKKHVLTRVLMAHLAESPEIDIHHTQDIRKGDVFFMCSDGVYERMDDEELCDLLTDARYTDEDRMQKLLSSCNDNMDNHTAWFVRVTGCDRPAISQVIRQRLSTRRVSVYNRIKLWLGSSR